MAAITMTLSGDREFASALDTWNSRVLAAFADLLTQTERELVSSLKESYPRGQTGNLRKGVRSKPDKRALFLSFQVKTTAAHAHLYELGTNVRRHRSGKSVGRMPAKPTFVPLVIRYRNRFNAQAKRALQQPAPGVGPGIPDVVEGAGNDRVSVFSGGVGL